MKYLRRESYFILVRRLIFSIKNTSTILFRGFTTNGCLVGQTMARREKKKMFS